MTPMRALAASHSEHPVVFTGSADGIVRCWRVDGEPLPVLRWLRQVGSLCEVACIDNGELIAIAGAGGVELARAEDGTTVRRIDYSGETFPLDDIAFSPDRRWVATGGFAEEIRLLTRDGWQQRASVEGGEYVLSMAFDSSSERLATACSFQNGAMVRLDRVSDGALTPIHEIYRATYETPDSEFVDKISGIALSPDGRSLALFETAAVGHEARPLGWRGNVAVYDMESAALRWERSLDAGLVRDVRSLADCGAATGYLARLAYDGEGNVVCGSTAGAVVVLDGASGERRRLVTLNRQIDVLNVVADCFSRMWAVSPDGALHRLD